MNKTILLKRGPKTQLPALAAGEAAVATDTGELFVGADNGIVNAGGAQWYTGTEMKVAGVLIYYRECPNVKVGDMYLNTSNGYVFQCITAGSGSNAQWTYKGCIKGIKGDAGKNARDVTCVIAASNSVYKDSADYICEGSNDQTVINQAISSLPSGGGKIILLEGTYYISSVITVNKSNVTIEGMGAATLLKRVSSIGSIMRTYKKNNCRYAHFTIDGGSRNNDEGEIVVNNKSSNITIEDVTITNAPNYSIWVLGGSDKVTVRNCRLDAKASGVVVDGSSDVLVDGCTVTSSNQGILLQNSQRVRILGNSVSGCPIGINMDTSGSSIASGNIVSVETGDLTYSICTLEESSKNIITGNIVNGVDIVNTGEDNVVINNVYIDNN